MSDHEWCRDTARDEAIRAAEDAAAVPAIQHRDLPEQVALLWASLGDIIGRVVRLEGEMDAGQDEEAATAEGMRKERVTPHWQRAKWDEALAIICDGGDWGRGNNFDHGVLGALVIWADKEMDRLTAERDAAIRERDAARSECKMLLAERDEATGRCKMMLDRVAELERDRRPATWQEEEAAVEGAWLLCGLEPDWPSDEPGTIVRHAESMRREVGRLRARVAELEAAAAPAANAGGEPHPPRGWMTAEMRDDLDEALEWLNCQTNVFAKRAAAAIATTLARSTPPRVKGPTGWAYDAHDMAWIAAIRDAGGEVE